MNPYKLESQHIDSVFNSDEYLFESSHELERMRHNAEFTDVVIECGNDTRHAHSIVLAGSSLYFREFLYFTRSKNGIHRVQLDEMDPHILNTLLTFIYTGHLELPMLPDQYRNVYLMSKTLRLTNFKRQMADAIKEIVSLESYDTVWKMATEFGIEEIENEVIKFVVNNFEDVSNHSTFPNMHAERLCAVLPRLQKRCYADDLLLKCIVKWVNFQEEQQMKGNTLRILLRFINFSKISESCYASLMNENTPNSDNLWKLLNKCYTNSKVISIPDKEAVITTSSNNSSSKKALSKESKSLDLCLHTHKGSSRQICAPKQPPEESLKALTGMSSPKSTQKTMINLMDKNHIMNIQNILYGAQTRKRSPSFVDNWIQEIEDADPAFLAEGCTTVRTDCTQSMSSFSDMSIFSPDKDILRNMQKFNGRSIVVFGKYQRSRMMMQTFGMQSYLWETAEMCSSATTCANIPNGAATVTCDNMLYFIGGKDSNSGQSLNETIVYKFDSNKFWKGSPMQIARTLAGAAELACMIYVMGGITIQDQNIYKGTTSVECHDTLKGTWRSVAKLPAAVWDVSVATCANTIYCLGGMDDMGHNTHCFAYSPRNNEWASITDLPGTFVENSAVTAVIKEKLYVTTPFIQGHDSMYYFEGKGNKWMQVHDGGGHPPLEKIVAILPCKHRLWALESTGKVFPFNVTTSQWEHCSPPFLKPMKEPMYAAILRKFTRKSKTVIL